MIVRERQGRFWAVVARMWRYVTAISVRIGITASLVGGLIIILIGFVTPGLLYGSILTALLGYVLGAALIVFGLMLFIRGVI